jgi:hypothetical protein
MWPMQISNEKKTFAQSKLLIATFFERKFFFVQSKLFIATFFEDPDEKGINPSLIRIECHFDKNLIQNDFIQHFFSSCQKTNYAGLMFFFSFFTTKSLRL